MFTLKITQNFIRGNFMRYFHKNGSIVMSKELGKYQQQPDELMQNIKSATDTLDLFDALSNHGPRTMNNDLVMQSLKALFVLQKSGNSSLQASQIAKHPQFEKLCRDLRSASRSLELNDIIESLKVLSYVGIDSDSNIVHILLNMLRRQINDVTLGHIMFLEFLLKKFDKTPIVEALQMALPMLFQIQLSTQIDHENVPELIELLSFAANYNVSEKCIMSIVSALTLHGSESIKAEEASSILWSLCELQSYKPNYERLLVNSFSALNKNYSKLTFNRLDITLKKIVYKFMLKFDSFYNEAFLNNVAQFAIENNVGFMKAIFIIKKFNKINFVNIPLLDYIAEQIVNEPNAITDARPAVYFSCITAFSTANYTPKNWNQIKQYILKNPIFYSAKNELPWMKFNLELMSIGCYDRNVLETIFDDEFLEKHLAREQNILDYLQMLSLYQSVRILCAQYDGKLPDTRFIDKAIELNLEKQQYPLKTSLEYIFGSVQFVQTKVSTKFGHLIEHVVLFDRDQRPFAINTERNNDDPVPIEELKSESNDIVAVISFPRSHYALNIPRLRGIFDLRIRTLKALGIPAVAVNMQQWAEMPEEERLAYLEREIRYAIQR